MEHDLYDTPLTYEDANKAKMEHDTPLPAYDMPLSAYKRFAEPKSDQEVADAKKTQCLRIH